LRFDDCKGAIVSLGWKFEEHLDPGSYLRTAGFPKCAPRACGHFPAGAGSELRAIAD
jgi:hypothetical protein